MRWINTVGLVLATSVAFSVEARAAGEALSRLKRSMDGWTAFEFTVRTEVIRRSRPDDSNKPHMILLEHYIQTAKGRRLLEDTSLLSDPGATNRYYHDGELAREFTTTGGRASRALNVVVKRDFRKEANPNVSEVPHPIKWLYLEQKPIHEILRTSDYFGEETRIGRKCQVYLCRKKTLYVKKSDFVYVLDEATGFPLEVRLHEAGREPNEASIVSRWQAREAGLVDGVLVPWKSSTLSYGREGNETQRSLKYESIHVIEKFELNKRYPDSLFRPSIPPGASVVDEVRKRVYVQPGSPEKRPAGDQATPPPPIRPVSVPPPVRSSPTPPQQRSERLPRMGLAVGSALLAAALLMSGRRNGRRDGT